jgi:AbrB family looped-hinge helix DNA binding protein
MEVYRTKINEDGRILIPAILRKTMHLKAGDELTLIMSDTGLQIATRRQVMERARQALRMDVPEGTSLVDELIRERREDAAKE